MAITFANVTDIKTNNGAYDIERITQTSTGRILWEKKNNDYYFMYVKPSYYKAAFTTGGQRYTGTSYMNVSVPNLGTGYTLPVRSWMSGGSLTTVDVASSGCTFMACYVTKQSEGTNVPSTALKLSDAKWETSKLCLVPLTSAIANSFTGGADKYALNNGSGGYAYGFYFDAVNIPIKFSSTSGSSIYIKNINSLDTCKGLYETYSHNSKYMSKTKAPYLGGWFNLYYTSETLRSKYNLPSTNTDGRPNYAPVLTIYFVIAR